MKNLKTREKVLISILLVAAIAYSYYTFFLSPILDKASISRDNITAYNNQLNDIKTVLENNSKYQEDYNMAQDKFNAYSAKMPYSARSPEIAIKLKNVADTAQATLNSVAFAEIGNDQQNQGQAQGQNSIDSNIVIVPVTISYNAANYLKAMSFINLLEKEDRMVQINSVNITKTVNSTTGSIAGVQADITANYFYLKSAGPQKVDYKFNNGVYGKSDLFK